MINENKNTLTNLIESCKRLDNLPSSLTAAQQLLKELNNFIDMDYFGILLRKNAFFGEKTSDKNHIIIGHNKIFHNKIWQAIQTGVFESIKNHDINKEKIIKDFIDLTVEVINLNKTNKAANNDSSDPKISYSLPLISRDSLCGIIVFIGDYQLNEDQKAIIDFFIEQFKKELEKQLLISELGKLAVTDNLTGAFNRNSMIERFKKEFSRAKRFYTPLSLIQIDVSNMKDIIDQYGHKLGDNMLEYTANILQKATRTIDLVGRYSSSGFTLILPHTKSDGCITLIKRINAELKNNLFKHKNKNITVKLAFGISSFPENNAINPDEFIISSENALSIAKENKPDFIYLYSSDPLKSNLA